MERTDQSNHDANRGENHNANRGENHGANRGENRGANHGAVDTLADIALAAQAEHLLHLALKPRLPWNAPAIGHNAVVRIAARLDDNTFIVEAQNSEGDYVNAGTLPVWQSPDSRPGDTLDCTVVSEPDLDGCVDLSMMQATSWSWVVAAFERETVIAALATDIARSRDGREVGVVLSIGAFRGFIPRKQINQHVPLARLVGTHLPVLITSLDEPKAGKSGEIVASYEKALAAQQQRFLEQLSIMRRFRKGDLLPFSTHMNGTGGEQSAELDDPAVALNTIPGIEVFGAVRKRIEPGLLVDIGHNLTGLVPKREFSTRDGDSEEVPLPGTAVTVEVIDVDLDKRQILLSLRGPKERRFFATLKEGAMLRGTVTSRQPFGVFVKLGPVTGLLHNSELKSDNDVRERIPDVGEEINVMVLKLDTSSDIARPRISLSRRIFSFGEF